MKAYLVKNKTLTGIVMWLNEFYQKKTGKLFGTEDVQNYIKRGCLPKYLGGHSIVRNEEIVDIKVYHIVRSL